MMGRRDHVARQLTYFSAYEKDEGRAVTFEAAIYGKTVGRASGMGRSRNGLQIHGGKRLVRWNIK